MELECIKQQMLIKLSLLVFLMTAVATIVRPILTQQDVLFTYLGVFNSILTGAAYLYVAKADFRIWHPNILTITLITVLIPLMIVSGGVNSQFSPILPLVPIVMALISQHKAVWISSIVVFLLLLFLFFFESHLPNITNEVVPSNKTIARLFWLILSCIIGLSFGLKFDSVIRTLSRNLHTQANTDSLTNTNNRGSIMSFLDTNIESAKINKRWLSVIMVDIDHFKSINDNYGHLAGDACLRDISQCLKENVRNTGDQVGRYGGEEFIIVLTDTNPAMTRTIAEKLRQAISTLSIKFEDQSIAVTATLGCSCLQGKQIDSKEKLLKIADSAMYVGKKSGRNQVQIEAST